MTLIQAGVREAVHWLDPHVEVLAELGQELEVEEVLVVDWEPVDQLLSRVLLQVPRLRAGTQQGCRLEQTWVEEEHLRKVVEGSQAQPRGLHAELAALRQLAVPQSSGEGHSFYHLEGDPFQRLGPEEDLHSYQVEVHEDYHSSETPSLPALNHVLSGEGQPSWKEDQTLLALRRLQAPLAKKVNRSGGANLAG